MMMKQRMLKTAFFKVWDEGLARMLATELQYANIEKPIDATKYARGCTTVEAQQGRWYNIQSVDAMCAALPHTNNKAAKCAKYNAQAIHHWYGFLTLFLTVTPDDDNHYTIQVLSQEFIGVNYWTNNVSNEALFEKSKMRTKLHVKYPGLCAIFLWNDVTDCNTWSTWLGFGEKETSTQGYLVELKLFHAPLKNKGKVHCMNIF
jgi:hypothetical protein